MILRNRFSVSSRAPRRSCRRGFTLLEILLAAMIASLLLAALYAALYSTLLQTQSTRDAIETEDLTRGVFNKISIDLTGTLSPLPPKSGGNSAASNGGVAPAADGSAMPSGSSDPAAMASGTGSAAPATTTPTTTTTADPSAATAMAGVTDNATAASADYAFQGGVIGEEGQLVIYAGRVPEVFGRPGNSTNSEEQTRSDQRQIIYWLEPGRGLYRRERPWITADGVRNAIEADPDAPDAVLLAEEVTSLVLAYTDGISGSWASTWDGTAAGQDGVTPLGPPRAIKVTLRLKIPVSKGEPVEKEVSQIIVVRSAPGTARPTVYEAPTDGAAESTTPTDPSTSGTTTSGGTTGGMTGGATGGMTGTTGGKTGGTSTGTGGKTGGTSGAPSGTPSGGMSGGKTGGTSGAPSGGTSGAPSGGMSGGRSGGTSGGTGGTGGARGGK